MSDAVYAYDQALLENKLTTSGFLFEQVAKVIGYNVNAVKTCFRQD